MTTTINADTVVGGAVVTADASGQLGLQAAGVTKLTVSSSGVTLAAALPIASGGTNATATPTAGGAVYGTGTAYAITAAGTSGQALVSAGASAPAFGTLGIAGGGTNATATPTAGGAVYGTGTAYAITAAGTSGFYLKSNGASAPTWAAVAASSVVFISSTIVSSAVASVTFTSLSNTTYAYYIVEFSNLLCSSNAQILYLSLSTDNGSTYSTARSTGVSTGGGVVQIADAATVRSQLAGQAAGVGTTTGYNAWGIINIFNAGAVGGGCTWHTGARNNAGSGSFQTVSAALEDASLAFNAIKIDFNGSNITGGRFYLYGVKNS